MKSTFIYITLVIAAFASVQVIAQTPEKMSYQAVLRDGDNDLLVNASVGMRVSILLGSATGTSVYTETHTTTSNENGLVTLEIGAGTTTDNFAAIDWGNGPFFVKTEIDPEGGTNYSIEGASQLLSVPYALFAKSAATIEELDPIFNNAVASEITAEDTTRWGTKELPVAQTGNIVTFDGNNWLARDLVLTTNTAGSSTAISNMQPYLVLNYCIALQGLYPSRNSADPFIGEIQLFGFNFAPRGFATCSGQLLAINQNQALYSLLGTMYGGDGRTTFGLPDLRGRAPISYGQGPGLSNRSMGQRSGTETFILNVNQMPAHNHVVNISYEP